MKREHNENAKEKQGETAEAWTHLRRSSKFILGGGRVQPALPRLGRKTRKGLACCMLLPPRRQQARSRRTDGGGVDPGASTSFSGPHTQHEEVAAIHTACGTPWTPEAESELSRYVDWHPLQRRVERGCKYVGKRLRVASKMCLSRKTAAAQLSRGGSMRASGRPPLPLFLLLQQSAPVAALILHARRVCACACVCG